VNLNPERAEMMQPNPVEKCFLICGAHYLKYIQPVLMKTVLAILLCPDLVVQVICRATGPARARTLGIFSLGSSAVFLYIASHLGKTSESHFLHCKMWWKLMGLHLG